MRKNVLALILISVTLAPMAPVASVARPEGVVIRNDQLYIDGVAQPQLFGAELQYFRLRGGQGPNIPRERVLNLWAKALDRMAEARMNALSFYIPWDFHEYAEGKFDFDGTVDEDGDGRPDYPSRDIFTFLRMAEARGIRVMMARPGPYINAEWGFLGFGAVPQWFHEKFPDSHMRDARGYRTKLYDYHDPNFAEYTRRWFREVYRQVIQPNVGPGKPIAFLQLDNETNYMWSPIYVGDYSARGLARYRKFLRTKYRRLDALNRAQGTAFGSWEEATAPTEPKKNLGQDRDWYEFQDGGIHSYLKGVRRYWEELGLREPDVLFTLAESYNAPDNGLLPHYRYRNDPQATGMMTVNLYPKTYDTEANPLLNLPFKTDHDVKSAETATDYYLGSKQSYVMGPEIQGGWWKGIRISREARQQTYLTVLGHGMKALFVYYFNEGDNWGTRWNKQQVAPHYEALRRQPRYARTKPDALPWKFWEELQAIVDREVLVGVSAWQAYHQPQDEADDLYFDAPLDKNAEPRNHFFDLKELAEKVIYPYRNFLGKAVAVEDRVCLLRDSFQHEPSPNPAINSILLNGEWSGGLLGWIMQTGTNPQILHWGLNSVADLQSCDVIFYQDNGATDPGMINALRGRLRRGAVVVNFLENSVPAGLGVKAGAGLLTDDIKLRFGDAEFAPLPKLSFVYELNDPRCRPYVLTNSGTPAGYECAWNGGGRFVQIGSVPYQTYNSDNYGTMTDANARIPLLRALLALGKSVPRVQISEQADRTVAFARTYGGTYWITTKTGAAAGSRFTLRVNGLRPATQYLVRDLLGSAEFTASGADLAKAGFPVDLAGNGSTVFVVEPREEAKR